MSRSLGADLSGLYRVCMGGHSAAEYLSHKALEKKILYVNELLPGEMFLTKIMIKSLYKSSDNLLEFLYE